MTNYFLGLPPLRGHLDEECARPSARCDGHVPGEHPRGGPAEVKHPRLIERYLHSGMPRGDQYVDYRAAMIKLLTP